MSINLGLGWWCLRDNVGGWNVGVSVHSGPPMFMVYLGPWAFVLARDMPRATGVVTDIDFGGRRIYIGDSVELDKAEEARP